MDPSEQNRINSKLLELEPLEFGVSLSTQKISKVSPSSAAAIESDNVLGVKRPLREEMQQVTAYLSEFKPSKIVTPFKGTSLLMSKDKSLFYFGSREGRIGIAKIESKETIQDVDLHEGTIWTIAMYNNDKFMFSGGVSGMIKKFSVEDMRQIQTLNGHTDEVNVILITNDEKTMYSTGDDSTVLKWDITREQPEPEQLYKHKKIVYGLDLSADNKYLASVSGDRTVAIYDISTKSMLHIIESQEFGVTWCIKITQTNKYLAFGDSQSIVYVYSFFRWERLKVFKGHTQRVRCINATYDERFIISGGIDNEIYIWDMAENRKGVLLTGHTDWVKAIIISPDNKFIYSMSDDCSIQTWRIPKFDNYTINVHADNEDETGHYFSTGSRSPENLYLITDTKVIKIDRSNDCVHNELSLPHSRSLNVAIHPKTDQICVISYDSYNRNQAVSYTFKYFKGTTFEEESSKVFESYGIFSALYSNDGVYLIIGEMFRCTILLAETLTLYHTFRSHKNQVSILAISSDNKYLFSVDNVDIIIKSYNFYKKVEIKAIVDSSRDKVKALRISSDNEYLVVLLKSFRATIWATSKMIRVHSLILEETIDLKFSKSSNNLYCFYKNCIRAIDFPSFTICFEIALHEGIGKYFTFSTDLKDLVVYQSNGIYNYRNPDSVQSLSIYGDISKLYEFYNYFGKITSGKQVEYNRDYNKWIIQPFNINAMHIYAYFNKIDFLEHCINDNGGFIVSKSKYTPLDICFEMSIEPGIDLIYSEIRRKSKKVPLFSAVLEHSLIRICSHSYPKASRFLDLLLNHSIDVTLSRYHHSNSSLPIIIFSSTLFCSKESFVGKNKFSNEGQGIEFMQTYFRLNMTPGSNESLEFIKTLMVTENELVFSSTFIQTLLSSKWIEIRSILYFQAVIYMTYLLLLSAYSSLNDLRLLIGCFVFNILLILYEIGQMMTSGQDYLRDAWNYLDIIRSGLMTLMFLEDLLDFGIYFDFLVAVVLFFSWIRGLSYFRIIKVTRYYINLIYEVIFDILPFLSILFYSTIAFSLIFGRLLGENDTYFSYLTTSWEINVGGFTTTDYGKLMYISFFLHTLLNPIIMLNLLISIMSNTFNRVNSQIIVADSRELAQMILEGELIFFWRRNSVERKYFHICKTLRVDKHGDKNSYYMKELKSKVKDLASTQIQIQKSLNDLSASVEEIKKFIIK